MSVRIIDISVPIESPMIVFGGDPQPRIEQVARLADGDASNVSRLETVVHCGTHVDAPSHFLDGGATTDSIPLDALVGPVHVIDATDVDGDIGAAALADRLPADAERVLLKTRNSELWKRDRFVADYCAVTPDGAMRLCERGVRLVGIDYLAIAAMQDPAPTHRALLSAGVVILEGIDLGGVAPGGYELLCLPIRLRGSDGAPARAVLLDRSAAE